MADKCGDGKRSRYGTDGVIRDWLDVRETAIVPGDGWRRTDDAYGYDGGRWVGGLFIGRGVAAVESFRHRLWQKVQALFRHA